MKKRGIFFAFSIILLLAVMPNVSSIYGESVYSGTVEDRELINISGHTFEFIMDSVSNKAYVEVDISAVIIPVGDCKIKEGFNICIKNISFSHRDVIAYNDVYQAIVEIYQIKSQLDISNTIDKSSILIDEEATVELSIENIADIVAEDVTAVINIPSSVLVIDVDGCKKTFDTVVFNGNVHPTQIRKCTYKIKGLSGDDFELKANVTYFNGIEMISTTSNTIEAKVYNYSLRITSELNKSKFDIWEKLNLTVKIENINDQHDLRVTILNIKIPENLLILKKPMELAQNNQMLSWSGNLPAGEDKNFLVQLQASKTSSKPISAEASYKISTFPRTTKKEFNIEVYCNCPNISHEFSQPIVMPGQRLGLKAYLANPSQNHNFKNVKVSYITNVPDIQDFSIARSKINPLESIKIFDSAVTVPDLNETYYFNITAIYESSFSQIFVVRDNIIIKVPDEEEIEETAVDEPQIVEENESESQQEAEVLSGTEQTEEQLDTTEEESKEKEIPVTTITEEKKKPITALGVIAYIAGIFFILISLIIFKRSKKGLKEGSEEGLKEGSEEGHGLKEFFSIVFRKKEKSERARLVTEKEEFEDLEKQIRSLGSTLEKEHQKKIWPFGRKR